jgi:N-acetylglucosaminyl-diphospho-decaprenol L-rhamnosyltransferase
MQPSANLDLSIIVVSYNTRDLLDQCLTSVFAHPRRLAFEVIVVDNASSDGSPELVARKWPSIVLLRNAHNQGFAKANNEGLEVCRGRYALLLNSDAEIRGDALEIMVAYLDSHPGVGIVGAQLRNSDGSLQPSGNRIPSVLGQIWWSLPFYRLFAKGQFGNRFLVSGRDYEQIAEVDEVSGAALVVRREVWESIGMLDEGYFFYFEDVDFCIRAKKACWRVMYVPQAKVVHHWGQSSKRPGLSFHVGALKSHFHYMRKVHGRFGELVFRIAMVIKAFFKIIVAALQCLGGSEEQKSNVRINIEILRLSIGLRTSV